MKKKWFTIIGVIFTSLIIVGVVSASTFSMGNIDGVWGTIDTNGASCDRWATGGTTPNNYEDPTTTWDGYNDQTPPNTDMNQVRYGAVNFFGERCWLAFEDQSGFGFNGTDLPPAVGFKEAFVLGKFCHFNHSISANNPLESVPLTITITDLLCDNGTTPTPALMEFDYIFGLDETGNTAPCPYPGTNPCSDAVFISQAPDDQQFTCTYEGGVTQEYSISLKGFMMQNPDGSCPAWNAANSMGTFYSEEDSPANCACLYAVVSDEIITAVELLSFTAESTENAIVLTWQTANEIENLGFNVYRAESIDGAMVKLNDALIPTNVMPGSLEGASYTFEDPTAVEGTLYYYWLEDVDASSLTTLHGPVIITK